MSIDVMVTAVIETSLNKLLVLDPLSAQRLTPLAGKCIKLELREFKPLWLIFSRHHIDVLAHYEGVADAELSLALSALGLLNNPTALTHYIRTDKLDISGDPQLVLALSTLLGELAIDWEERLSGYVGDVVAHGVYRGARQVCHHLHRGVSHVERQLADYLTEEGCLVASPLAVAYFNDEVDRLMQDVNAIEVRVAHYEMQVNP